MSAVRLLVLALLSLQLANATGIRNGLRNFCRSLNCFSTEDQNTLARPFTYAGIVCPNPQVPQSANRRDWNIKATRDGLPTVAEIAADLRLCGIINERTTLILYTFGAGRSAAERFRDANPQLNGVLITTVMPISWDQRLGELNPDVQRADDPAQIAWNTRLSQALASVASGDVYVLCGGTANIHTIPLADDRGKWAWRGPHNVFHDVELHTLQSNPAVRNIFTVNTGSFAVDRTGPGSWRPSDGVNAAQRINADTVSRATIQRQIDAYMNRNCPAPAPGTPPPGPGSAPAPGAPGSRPGSPAPRPASAKVKRQTRPGTPPAGPLRPGTPPPPAAAGGRQPASCPLVRANFPVTPQRPAPAPAPAAPPAPVRPATPPPAPRPATPPPPARPTTPPPPAPRPATPPPAAPVRPPARPPVRPPGRPGRGPRLLFRRDVTAL